MGLIRFVLCVFKGLGARTHYSLCHLLTDRVDPLADLNHLILVCQRARVIRIPYLLVSFEILVQLFLRVNSKLLGCLYQFWI